MCDEVVLWQEFGYDESYDGNLLFGEGDVVMYGVGGVVFLVFVGCNDDFVFFCDVVEQWICCYYVGVWFGKVLQFDFGNCLFQGCIDVFEKVY